MTVAVQETREDKLRWLLQPFWWAVYCGSVCTAPTLYCWHQGSQSAQVTALSLLMALALSVGCTGWGIWRMTRAAKS